MAMNEENRETQPSQGMDGIAGYTAGERQAYLWSLVLSAVHIPHGVRREGEVWVIRVPAGAENAARHELAEFEHENRNWPPPKKEAAPGVYVSEDHQPPVILLMGLLMIFYGITGPWSSGSEWFKYGAVANSRILEHGEWWRVITGLTLHADAAHLFGNVMIGGLLVYYLCKVLGSGLGVLLLLLCGALGNGINVLVRGDTDFLSVGFSTAVFGAVGLLSGLHIARIGSLRGLLLSVGAAASMLAFLGSKGERVDLGAHLWGVGVGLAIGYGLAKLPDFLEWAAAPSRQFLFQILAALILGGAWWAAFHL